MKSFKILTLVCAILLLTIPAAGVLAQDAPRDEGEYEKQPYRHEPPKEKHRELWINKEPHFASVTSTNGGENNLFFEFNLMAEQSLSVQATFAKQSEDGGEKTGIMIDFSGLVEYEDVNGDGQFEYETDKVISTYSLSGDFFQSDFILGKNEFKDQPFQNEPDHNMDRFLEHDYMEGYNQGFNKGFHHGYEIGEKDFEQGLGFEPDVHMHFTDEELRKMLGFPEPVVDDDSGEKDPVPDDEMIDEMGYRDYGFFKGFIMGFETGYKMSYDQLKEEAEGEEKTGTRQEPPHPEDEDPPEDEHQPDGENEDRDEQKYWEEYEELIRLGLVEPPKFESVNYKPIELTREVQGKDKQTIILSVSDREGVFKIVCKISNDFTKIENGYLSPYSIKIDIHINDYPFKEEATLLALLTDVGITTSAQGDFLAEKKEKSFDEERRLAEDEEELRISGPEFQGFFSWVKYAMCDGKNLTVKVGTTPSHYGEQWSEYGYHSENFQGLVFNYPRANSIIHDPKVGFIQVSDINVYEDLDMESVQRFLTGNVWIYAVTAVVAIVFIGVTRKVRKKYY